MKKESKLNLNAGDYAISHCDSDKTYNGLEVHKMLCDAYIAGSNDTLDDEAYRKAYYDGYNKCNRDWIYSQEDEKTRKALIDFFGKGAKNGEQTNGVYDKDVLAWLEKQDESIDINPSEFDLHLNKLLKQFETLPKEELVSSLSFYLNVVQSDGTYKEEKQGEQKPEMKTAEESLGIDSDTYNKIVDECLFGEQKPADKVESHFHVEKGKWYMCIKNNVGITKGNAYYGISDGYIIDDNGRKYNCNNWAVFQRYLRLWTIQDAKSGDVLSNGKMIVIFKHFEEPSYRQHIVAYIGLDIGGDIQITDDTWRLGIDKAKPATKEQRDLLFQKMTRCFASMWSSIILDRKEYPEVTWENSPKELVIKEEGKV